MVLCKDARDQETRPGGGFVLRNASPMLLAGLTPEKREGTQNGFRLVARIVWSIFVGEGAKRVADIGLVTGIESRALPSQLPFRRRRCHQGKPACSLCSGTPAATSDPSLSRQPGTDNAPNGEPLPWAIGVQ